MTKTAIAVVIALIVGGAAWYWHMGAQKGETAADGPFGTYAYVCDNGTRFDMALFTDNPSVLLKAQGAAPFSEVVLNQKSGSTYATEDGEVVLVGEGEQIKLTVGAASMTCNPVPSDDMAPFNWGDASEGPDANTPDVQGKLNIDAVCQGALAYTTFPDAASADVFVQDCKDGKHPEVIERYKADMNLGDGAAI